MTGQLGCPLVSSDELIGNIVQVTAYDLRLRADPQEIIADALDQRSPPACRDGAEGVPRVAGDKAQLRGLNSKFVLDISVSLSRRLMKSRKPALRSLRSAAGTSGWDGIVENFSASSSLSLSPILMPRVSASIFMTAEPISVNRT